MFGIFILRALEYMHRFSPCLSAVKQLFWQLFLKITFEIIFSSQKYFYDNNYFMDVFSEYKDHHELANLLIFFSPLHLELTEMFSIEHI